MQQRYYDPSIGRFLSVDPVTATSVGGNFNRYWYADNNPYRFTDPDGRLAGDGSSQREDPYEKEQRMEEARRAREEEESKRQLQERRARNGHVYDEPQYCAGGADCDFMYNQNEFLANRLSDDEFSARTEAQGRGGAAGAAGGLILAFGGEGYALASAGAKKLWGNIKIQGPSAGLQYANGSILRISFRGSNYNIRLDYAPIPGSKGTPILHLNYGPSGRGRAPHIVIWDPRWYTPNLMK